MQVTSIVPPIARIITLDTRNNVDLSGFAWWNIDGVLNVYDSDCRRFTNFESLNLRLWRLCPSGGHFLGENAMAIEVME